MANNESQNQMGREPMPDNTGDGVVLSESSSFAGRMSDSVEFDKLQAISINGADEERLSFAVGVVIVGDCSSSTFQIPH